jgi:small ligand-binding sensory domain FIST
VSASGRFRAALSLHPVAAAATGEVIGDVLESVGPGPDLAVLAVGGSHRRSVGAVVDAVRSTLGPSTLVTVCTNGFSVGGRHVGDEPAVGLWVGWCRTVAPVALTVPDEPGGPVAGVDVLPDDGTVVLVGSGGHNVAGVIDELAQRRPGLRVVGGVLESGDTVMVDAWQPSPSQHVLVGWTMPTTPVTVAHGCRAVGAPMVVTRRHGAVVDELAGTPALDQLDALVGSLSGAERDLVAHGLMMGVAVDQSALDVDADHVVVRSVVGVVGTTRAIALDDPVEVGSLVSFMVADPESAVSRLRSGLGGLLGGAAVVFAGARRREYPLGIDDASVVAEALGSSAVVGFRCAGEIGPVRTRSWLHRNSAVTVACR